MTDWQAPDGQSGRPDALDHLQTRHIMVAAMLAIRDGRFP